MTTAVDLVRKATKQTNKQNQRVVYLVPLIEDEKIIDLLQVSYVLFFLLCRYFFYTFCISLYLIV